MRIGLAGLLSVLLVGGLVWAEDPERSPDEFPGKLPKQEEFLQPAPTCSKCAAAKALKQQEGRGLDTLLETAKAVVLAEILSTDTSATAADGPMRVEAKVLKCLKGQEPHARSVIRFGASAWMGPTYQPGERRALLLTPWNEPGSDPWMSVEVGHANLFFDEAVLAGCTENTLSEFLKQLGPQPRGSRVDLRCGGS